MQLQFYMANLGVSFYCHSYVCVNRKLFRAFRNTLLCCKKGKSTVGYRFVLQIDLWFICLNLSYLWRTNIDMGHCPA